VPLRHLTLRVRVPEDVRVAQVRRFWENRELPFQVTGRLVSLEVDPLNEYEAVAVEWEPLR
jgi:hypothetical protein